MEIAQCSRFAMFYLYIMSMSFVSYCGTVAYCFGACKMPSSCFGQIVVMTYRVCVELLLRFECALYETCLELHEVSYYHVASMF